ncbi:Starch synthase [Macleaya cordata]|uniref:starch synthase n=1 Tax=Macleaya cordata TaxID=56857 RepID=A0A200QA36_MACCD|nr:Starch synthase [Macleaya cordata]
METLVNAVTSYYSHHYFFQVKTINREHVKARTVCCSRSNEKVNGLFSGSSQIELEDHKNMEMLQDPFQSSNTAPENHNDIWKLFRETQRNILYLNKQRLMAVDEMKKTQKEKQLLLDRIEQLEVELASIRKSSPVAVPVKPSICSELLLRIDSMVLTGVIVKEEASNLRSLVTDNKVSIADVFSDIQQLKDSELLAELRHFSVKSKRTGFHIVHICTEMAPMASVGSLALYVTGISCELQENGNLVEVILPKYASLDLDEVQGLRDIKAEFYSYFDGNWHANRIWTGVVHGIGVTFIDPVNYSAFFNRDMIYGYSDDFERFSYLSRASLDYIVKSGKKPAVLHIHNWGTAVVGPLFWDVFVNQGLGGTRILFTCHDFKTQCLVKPDKLALCGLNPSRLHRPDRLQDNTEKHLVNVLKGGIVYSNKVVMMSSIHSKGRIICSLSHGLESTLAIHKDKLLLAPYGFDCSVWDPSKDKFLPAKYSVDDVKGKAICKAALRQHLELSGHASTVVVGCICSDVSDVDWENLKASIQLTLRRGAQFILMGSSKIPSVRTALESFRKKLEDEDLRIINRYDEALSHLILAGADIIFCPSFHDPVLQVPLKAIKYGAAPVALSLNGDLFRHTIEHDFLSTRTSEYITSDFGNTSLSDALDQITKNTFQWNQKMKDGMAKDFSWGAECYNIHLTAYTSIKNL